MGTRGGKGMKGGEEGQKGWKRDGRGEEGLDLSELDLPCPAYGSCHIQSVLKFLA